MAKSSDDRKKLLEALREAPFISHACKKIGVARATFYRWKEDPAFAHELQDALQMGRDRGCDIAEAALYKAMQDGNMSAIRFFLQNNDPRYAPKRPIQVNQHISLQPGESCPFCNTRPEHELTEEDKEELNQMLHKLDPAEDKPKGRKTAKNSRSP